MKAAVLLVLLSTATVAHAGSEPASPAAGADKPAARAGDDAVVCEKKRELGSKLVKRVCTTEDGRRAEKTKAQAELHRLGRCNGNETACSDSL